MIINLQSREDKSKMYPLWGPDRRQSNLQGYNEELFLQAESHDHSTMSYSEAMIGGIGNIQPYEVSGKLIFEKLNSPIIRKL